MSSQKEATLPQLISSALSTVAEGATHREWISSAACRRKICKAPRNMQDVALLQTESFLSGRWHHALPWLCFLLAAIFVFFKFHSQMWVFKVCVYRGGDHKLCNHKSKEQTPLTWCWFDEHNVEPLSLPNPSSVCWPKRALFKTHKSHPPRFTSWQ